jgi:hypothetical protein
LSCPVVSLCALLFLHALLFCLVPYCFAPSRCTAPCLP